MKTSTVVIVTPKVQDGRLGILEFSSVSAVQEFIETWVGYRMFYSNENYEATVTINQLLPSRFLQDLFVTHLEGHEILSITESV